MAADAASGAPTIANNKPAPSSDRFAAAPSPAFTASTAPAPKISTGTHSGSTSNASRLPPPRRPSVSAAPIAPSSDRIGVPSSSADRQHRQRFAVQRVLQPEQRRQDHDRQPGGQPMRRYFTGHQRRQRIRRQRDLLERAIGVVGREQPRQRQAATPATRRPTARRVPSPSSRFFSGDSSRAETATRRSRRTAPARPIPSASASRASGRARAPSACRTTRRHRTRARRVASAAAMAVGHHDKASARTCAAGRSSAWCVATTAHPPRCRWPGEQALAARRCRPRRARSPARRAATADGA